MAIPVIAPINQPEEKHGPLSLFQSPGRHLDLEPLFPIRTEALGQPGGGAIPDSIHLFEAPRLHH
jgi:hypothetical protein